MKRKGINRVRATSLVVALLLVCGFLLAPVILRAEESPSGAEAGETTTDVASPTEADASVTAGGEADAPPVVTTPVADPDAIASDAAETSDSTSQPVEEDASLGEASELDAGAESDAAYDSGEATSEDEPALEPMASPFGGNACGMLSYRSYSKDNGVTSSGQNGEICGTVTGASNPDISSFGASLSGISGVTLVAEVRTGNGSWQTASLDTGSTDYLLGVRMRLTGPSASAYHIWYRVFILGYGWLGWAKDGEAAGSSIPGYWFEAVQAVVLPSNMTPKSAASSPSSVTSEYESSYFVGADIRYMSHIQSVGWEGETEVLGSYKRGGEISGTSGKSLRIEAFMIFLQSTEWTQNLNSQQSISGGVRYRAHVQGIGWQPEVANGALAGTSGQSRRVEAISISLYGGISEYYSVYYRVHVQGVGWMGWAKDGELAGTSGQSRRIEAIQICLCKKNGTAPSYSPASKVSFAYLPRPSIHYSAHVQSVGWQPYVADGALAGTTGKSLRVEAFRAFLDFGESTASGAVQYRAHVQSEGWQGWVSGPAIAGTVGKSRRVEAIQMRLTGDAATYFDIYYRCHVQGFGWLGWAKNGASAGSSGYSRRIEAFEVRIVPKGSAAPGSTANPYRSK